MFCRNDRLQPGPQYITDTAYVSWLASSTSKPTRVSSSLIGCPLSYGLVPHLSKKLSKFPLLTFHAGATWLSLGISYSCIGTSVDFLQIFSWRTIFICTSHQIRFDTRYFLKLWIKGRDSHADGNQARSKWFSACHWFIKYNMILCLSILVNYSRD